MSSNTLIDLSIAGGIYFIGASFQFAENTREICNAIRDNAAATRELAAAVSAKECPATDAKEPR